MCECVARASCASWTALPPQSPPKREGKRIKSGRVYCFGSARRLLASRWETKQQVAAGQAREPLVRIPFSFLFQLKLTTSTCRFEIVCFGRREADFARNSEVPLYFSAESPRDGVRVVAADGAEREAGGQAANRFRSRAHSCCGGRRYWHRQPVRIRRRRRNHCKPLGRPDAVTPINGTSFWRRLQQ